MGIAGFQRWFFDTFPDACTPVTSDGAAEHYDHVLFDVNQLLHVAARRARDEDHFIVRLYFWLDRVLAWFPPDKSVLVAFDGPAPMAKLVTQKRRRMKEAAKQQRRRRESEKRASAAIDPLQFSPGTELMQRLVRAVEFYACSRLQSQRRVYGRVRFVVSGPTVPGEGEVKIVDYVHRYVRPNESVLVVGSDADLVLLGLATRKVVQLSLLVLIAAPPSEEPAPESSGARRKRRTGPRAVRIHIPRLLDVLERWFPGEADHVRNDLVVLSMMQGNDYLPKLRGGAFPNTWNAYVHLKAPGGAWQGQHLVLGSQRTLNLQFLSALMQQANHPEVPELTPEMLARNRLASQRGQLMAAGVELADEEMVEADNDPEYEEMLAVYGGERQLHDTAQWLRALLWTLAMYVDGYCPDYFFTYPKLHAPSSADIVRWIDENDGDPVEELHPPVSNAPPLLPHAALLALLPPSATHLLPSPLYARCPQEVNASANGAPDIPAADAVLRSRIEDILRDDGRNITPARLEQVIQSVPEHEYDSDELQRTRLGHAVAYELLRASTRYLVDARAPRRPPPPPVERFTDLRHPERSFRITRVRFTTSPPCMPWAPDESV